MSDTRQFEPRFAEQLRSYAGAGAPTLAREQVARAVAAGVASRTRPRIGMPWTRTSTQSRTIVPQFAAVAVIILIAAVGFAIWFGGNNAVIPPGGTPLPSTTPSPSPSLQPTQPVPTTATAYPIASATPTGVPDKVDRGWIAFAADSMAGPDLSTPVDFASAEGSPTDMDIYLVREGGTVRRIVGTTAHERCPVFSPDGTRLAYVESPADGDSGEAAIVVTRFDPDAESLEAQLRVPLYPSGRFGNICPQWSPDGASIAFESYGTINVPGSATMHLTVISALDGHTVVESRISAAPLGGFAWSPNGEEIAFAVRPPSGTLFGSHLSLLRLDGGAERVLWTADDATELGHVAWSPGENIAVVASTTVPTGPNSASGSVSVLIGPADGSRELQPVGGVSPAGYVGSWSPDGGTLAIATETGVAIVGSDGSTHTDVGLSSPDGAPLQPWVPNGVTWSPDGQRLLTMVRNLNDAGSPSRWSPPAIASFALDGSNVDLLTPYTWAFNWVAPDDLSWQPIR